MFDKEQKRGYKQSAKNLARIGTINKEDRATYILMAGAIVFTIKYTRKHTQTLHRKSVYYADEPESAPLKRLYMNERAIKT